ncbi:hypothetical protein N7504_004569 [Penicillium tannophilum]|nr:hypothetical protein N7504_004569 [Penicillium tannophilum]
MTSFVLRPLWPLEGHDSDMFFAFGLVCWLANFDEYLLAAFPAHYAPCFRQIGTCGEEAWRNLW